MAPKVVLVSHWDWVLFNYRIALARHLREIGCEVLLVCPRGEHVEHLANEDFEWREWDVDRSGTKVLGEVASVTALARIYRSFGPDLVHHFTMKPNLYGTLAAALARQKRVVNTFSGLGFLFSGDRESERLRKRVEPIMRFAFKRRFAWSIVQNSEDLGFLVERGLIDQRRAELIPECVDIEVFHPPSSKSASLPITVLMAGRLLWDKGVAELINASRMLADRGVELRVLVAGEPDPGNPSSIPQGQLEEWSRSSGVEFLGMRDDMPDQLRRTDVAVLPSYHEGVPRFLLEAAASGVPIVATDIPGCRAIVEEGVNGFLVPVRDADALAMALERLAKDDELRSHMGSAGVARAENSFSERRMVEQHVELYRRLGAF